MTRNWVEYPTDIRFDENKVPREIGRFFDIPVYENPLVPKNEVWVVNTERLLNDILRKALDS